MGAARLRDGGEVGLGLEIDRQVPLTCRLRDPLDPVQARVVDHDPKHGGTVLEGGRDLLHVHLEGAVARDADHGRFGPRQLRPDRTGHPQAHDGLLGGCDTAAQGGHLHERAVIRPQVLSAVLVDEHEPFVEGSIQRVHDLLRHQVASVGRALELDPALELLLECDQLGRPGPCFDARHGGYELRQDELHVTYDRDVGLSHTFELELVDVDLHDPCGLWEIAAEAGLELLEPRP